MKLFGIARRNISLVIVESCSSKLAVAAAFVELKKYKIIKKHLNYCLILCLMSGKISLLNFVQEYIRHASSDSEQNNRDAIEVFRDIAAKINDSPTLAYLPSTQYLEDRLGPKQTTLTLLEVAERHFKHLNAVVGIDKDEYQSRRVDAAILLTHIATRIGDENTLAYIAERRYNPEQPAAQSTRGDDVGLLNDLLFRPPEAPTVSSEKEPGTQAPITAEPAPHPAAASPDSEIPALNASRGPEIPPATDVRDFFERYKIDKLRDYTITELLNMASGRREMNQEKQKSVERRLSPRLDSPLLENLITYTNGKRTVAKARVKGENIPNFWKAFLKLEPKVTDFLDFTFYQKVQDYKDNNETKATVPLPEKLRAYLNKYVVSSDKIYSFAEVLTDVFFPNGKDERFNRLYSSVLQDETLNQLFASKSDQTVKGNDIPLLCKMVLESHCLWRDEMDKKLVEYIMNLGIVIGDGKPTNDDDDDNQGFNIDDYFGDNPKLVGPTLTYTEVRHLRESDVQLDQFIANAKIEEEKGNYAEAVKILEGAIGYVSGLEGVEDVRKDLTLKHLYLNVALRHRDRKDPQKELEARFKLIEYSIRFLKQISDPLTGYNIVAKDAYIAAQCRLDLGQDNTEELLLAEAFFWVSFEHGSLTHSTDLHNLGNTLHFLSKKQQGEELMINFERQVKLYSQINRYFPKMKFGELTVEEALRKAQERLDELMPTA